ncbi:hypothetical protein RRU01S_04_00430 [Agrobacterium rubi TR3 = NBRC 13261]|uniref:Uncharacterized protein n=1 Tax=Agrobacterium rubi TR3 = NBRC 13261 TaxID=1368415 RepID=A0A081CRC5_9HYPH|nr:hypothetical protein RRU01S_04_00430 [Agrobacterium rubi TR3 = NBRC 13261]
MAHPPLSCRTSPHKEGDRLGALTSVQSQRTNWPKANRDSISPPVGEMSGRTEGGKPHPPTFTIKPKTSGIDSANRYNSL